MKLYSNTPAEYFEESPAKEGFNLKEFLLKYTKYWPYIFLSVILALSAAYVKNQFTAPTYKTESKFLIKENDNSLDILDLTGLVGKGVGKQAQKLANESILMKSKPLAEQVLGHLDFDVEYYTEGPFIKTEIYNARPVTVTLDWDHTQLTDGFLKLSWANDQSFQVELVDDEYFLAVPGQVRKEKVENPKFKNASFAFGDWVESDLFKFKVNSPAPSGAGEIFLKFRDLKSLVAQYAGDNFQVFTVDETASILSLSLICNQPEKGQLYLNTLMEVYLDNELKDKTLIASNTVDFIDSQISGVADSLHYTGTDLQNYRANNRTYNIGSEGNSIFTQISELERTLAQERYKKEYYNKLQEYLVREEYAEIIMPSGSGIDDPILNTLIENLITLQAEKSRHLATQTEASPTVREANRKIKDLNASIKEVLRNVNQNASFVIEDLENQIAKLDEEFSRLPTTEQNLLRFQRKFDLNENIYTFLLQRRAESAITMASNTVSNKVVEYASLSFTPLPLQYITNYVLALIFGFAFPVVIIVGVNIFNTRIRDLKDVEKELAVPNLTYIGRKKLKSSTVVLKEPRAAVSEAFRSLRTNIYFISPRDKQTTIAITSSISGEGKSFCSLNLASAYSLNGKKTVLIDCDLHKNNDWKELNVENKVGLSSYLNNEVGILPIIQATPYPNLSVITGGEMPANPGELLLNGRMELLIKELRNSYDTIILDTPPIGLVSESLGLIHLSDLTLFVVRYNYSKKSVIGYINDLKVKKGIKNIYTVFNDVAGKELSYGGYGYGYYEEDKKKGHLLKRLLSDKGDKAAI